MFNTQLITEWAVERNLLQEGTIEGMIIKTTEELGELAAAFVRSDQEEMKDAIGDTAICLHIIAAMNGTSLDECMAHAYNNIKDRKGYIHKGVFRKYVMA